MKLCVVDFWEDAFDGDFFEYFFNVGLGGYERVTNHDEADIVVKSVFGNTQTDPKKTIMYIGENVRPNFMGYDYSLSFDYDTYGGRNCRLPLWYSRVEWPGYKYRVRKPNRLHHGYEPLISLAKLTSTRYADESTPNKRFCLLVANNPESLRISMFNSLSQYKQVDGYGNMFGRPLVASKFDVMKDYRFAMCPENSIYPGYVTEKLIDAYAGGCVPIYSGHPNMDTEFNQDAFLNYQDYLDMDNFVAAVKDIDCSEEVYEKYYNQPLLKEKPHLNHQLAFMFNTSSKIRRNNKC